MEDEFYENQKFRNPDTPNASFSELEALQKILGILSPLSKDVIGKLIKTVSTYFEIKADMYQPVITNNEHTTTSNKFTDNRDISAKEFLFEKSPQTDAERIACLAYYLTHYKDQEEFKTFDLSMLNTEAAQLKLTNAAMAVDSATRQYGFLVPTKKGYKKLSAIGELYVQALPDRESAREAIKNNKPKKRIKNKKQKINKV